MPPLPPSPNTVRLALEGLNQTHPWANIFHVQYVGTQPTNAVLDTLCTNVSTLWSTSIAAMVLPTCSLTQVLATDISSALGATGISTATHVGTSTESGVLPVGVAICVTWKTALRWRGGHPRTYMPGMGASTQQNGNSWNSIYRQAVQSAWATFHTGLNSLSAGGNSWSHVCVRRHQTNVDGSHTVLNPAVPVPITGLLVDSRIDSQRRRLGPDVAA